MIIQLGNLHLPLRREGRQRCEGTRKPPTALLAARGAPAACAWLCGRSGVIDAPRAHALARVRAAPPLPLLHACTHLNGQITAFVLPAELRVGGVGARQEALCKRKAVGATHVRQRARGTASGRQARAPGCLGLRAGDAPAAAPGARGGDDLDSSRELVAVRPAAVSVAECRPPGGSMARARTGEVGDDSSSRERRSALGSSFITVPEFPPVPDRLRRKLRGLAFGLTGDASSWRDGRNAPGMESECRVWSKQLPVSGCLISEGSSDRGFFCFWVEATTGAFTDASICMCAEQQGDCGGDGA